MTNGINNGHFKKGNSAALGKKHPHSEEHKRKLIEKLMGNKNGLGNKSNTGRKLSDEQRRQQSQRNKNNPNFKGSFIGSRLKGKDHPWYIDGRTPENKIVRGSIEMKLWKKACMERDNFTCQKTGQVGGNLEVHHINNFSSFKELRTSIENGITFSKETHKLFHKIYGNKNNTIEQVEEFICRKLSTV